MQLQPLTYKYKAEDTPTRYIGMVAQDVEKVYPELIKYHEKEDIYHMDYSATGVVAIKAIQELKAKNDLLNEKVKELEAKVAAYASLEERIQAIENNILGQEPHTASVPVTKE